MKQNIQTAALIAVSLMSVGSKKAEADRIQYNIDDALAASTDDNNKMSWVFSQHVKRDPATLTAATPEEKFDADGYNSAGYDRDGYDRDGFGVDGYNAAGWNRDGINKTTGTLYDEEGYDKDGWKLISKGDQRWNKGYIFKETGSQFGSDGYSKEGFDINGKKRDGSDYCTASTGGSQFLNRGTFYRCYCYTSDTPITLADGTTKCAKDITYEDELLVWNFDEGKFDKAKPIWLKVPEHSPEYNYMRFSDGSVLKTINQHRIFNVEAGKFTYPMTDETPLGTHTLNSKGELVELVEKKVVKEDVTYYNIITEKHINCFAGNILTSCRLNNIYPIKDLKFVKDNRAPVPYEEYAELDKKWYDGLRLSEQPEEINHKGDVYFNDKTITDYVLRLIKSMA